MKIEISDVLDVVREVLSSRNVDDKTIKESAAEIEKLAVEIKKEEKSEKEKKPRKEYVVVGFKTTDDKIFKGYVFQLNKDVEPALILEKLTEVKNDYCSSKKGQKRPAKTIQDSIELPQNKFFVGRGLSRKTKESIYIITGEG